MSKNGLSWGPMKAQIGSFVRIKQAAELLGVTPQTVRNWVASGRILAVRHPVNGYRLFDTEHLQQVLRSVGDQAAGQRTLFVDPPPPYNLRTKIVYRRSDRWASRSIQMPNGQLCSSRFQVNSKAPDTEYGAEGYDSDWLRLQSRPRTRSGQVIVTVGDAFCGGGVFSLGIEEALRGLSYSPVHSFGIDFNKDAIDAFASSCPGSVAIHSDIREIADGNPGSATTPKEREFLERIGGSVDVLVGGPPCQGHSDLNNHTRRTDPKNELYFSMVRLAELLAPQFLIIENVPGVVHDRGAVVAVTESELARLGYHVSKARIDLCRIGVPQRRKRFVLVASRIGPMDLDAAVTLSETCPRPLSWAVEDLLDAYDDKDPFNSSARHSPENLRRIGYLFAHDLYELPDAQRPPCHRDKSHSYNSVYGRMRWNEPAPTITGGFGSTGQGRFVHPRLPRTLTPHEACRLQFIPDYFRFPATVGRRSMQQIIGNAAPPRLGEMIIIGAAAQGVLF